MKIVKNNIELKRRKISEIFNIIGGTTPSTSNHLFWENGDISWIGPVDMNKNGKYISKGRKNITSIAAEKIKNKKISAGSIILSTRAPIGYVKINKKDLFTNQGCHSLTLKSKYIIDYFYYFFIKNTNMLNLISKGTTFKEVGKKELGELIIYYPEDIKQQERIAHILSMQEEQIERIKGLIKKLEKRNQYYAEKLLSGELRIRENKEAGKTELYENEEWQEVVLNGRNCKIPNGWNILKVQDIVKMSMGNTILNKDILKIDDFSGNLIPVFSATETLKVFGFIDKSKAKKTLNANDFIISARGTIGSVHRMKELSTSTQTTIQCVKIKEDNNILYYYLKNNRDNLLKGNGGAIPQLTIKMLNNIETVYPENEGLIISQFIEAINKELENVKKLLPKEEKRFQWMLDNLLSGEYEVVEN